MRTKLGKIARLPLDTRNELNIRLLEGEAPTPLLEWINNHPAALKILNSQFEGQLITIKDILAWRRGGYMEWALVRECAATARGLSESIEELATTGISAEHLLTVLTVQYARILNQLDTAPADELDQKLNVLRKLTNAALALRRREFQAARLEISRERLELAREKQLSNSANPQPRGRPALPLPPRAPQRRKRKRRAMRHPESQRRKTASLLVRPLPPLRFPISALFHPIFVFRPLTSAPPSFLDQSLARLLERYKSISAGLSISLRSSARYCAPTAPSTTR